METIRPKILFLSLLSLIGTWSSLASAGDKASQFGVLWGLSVPDADNTNTFHVFGVKGQAFLAPVFTAGGYYLTSDKAGETGSLGKFRYTLTGIEAAYHIPSAQGDTSLAFRVGMTKLQRLAAGSDITYSPYHYGIATGYDYFVTGFLSFGFEGSYLHMLPNRTNLNGVDYNQPAFNIINFLITLQMRL